MGYCSTKALDDAILAEQKKAEQAKQAAVEAGIFPKVRAIMSNSCGNSESGYGVVVYKANSGGYGVRYDGKVVYHAIIESSPTDFHYGAWIPVLDKILTDVRTAQRKRLAEHNKKGYKLRSLKGRYSL